MTSHIILCFEIQNGKDKRKKQKQRVRKKRTPSKEETKFEVFLECKNKHETTQVAVSHKLWEKDKCMFCFSERPSE